MPITAGHPKDVSDVKSIENYKGGMQLNGFTNSQQALIMDMERVGTSREKPVKNDIIVK